MTTSAMIRSYTTTGDTTGNAALTLCRETQAFSMEAVMRGLGKIMLLTGLASALLSPFDPAPAQTGSPDPDASQQQRARAQMNAFYERLDLRLQRLSTSVCTGCELQRSSHKNSSHDLPRRFDPAQAPDFER